MLQRLAARETRAAARIRGHRLARRLLARLPGLEPAVSEFFDQLD